MAAFVILTSRYRSSPETNGNRRRAARPSSKATIIRGSIKSFPLNSSRRTFTSAYSCPFGIGTLRKSKRASFQCQNLCKWISSFFFAVLSCAGNRKRDPLYATCTRGSSSDPWRWCAIPSSSPFILTLFLLFSAKLANSIMSWVPSFHVTFGFFFFFCSRSDFMGCMSFSVSHVIRKVSRKIIIIIIFLINIKGEPNIGDKFVVIITLAYWWVGGRDSSEDRELGESERRVRSLIVVVVLWTDWH